MRLQHKNFTFTLIDGDKTMSRILTSNVVIDNKITNLLISQLFHGVRKEAKNTVRGYSILEFVDNDGNIDINDKIYNIQFTGDKDNFILKSITDPVNYQLNDKNLTDDESSEYETLITNALTSVQVQEQPLESKTDEEVQPAGVALFTNEDYNVEKTENPEFVEYNTSPVSNMKLLVNENALPEDVENDVEEKLVLIEIESPESFAILIRNEYNIELNQNDKTFTFEKIIN